MICPIAVLKDPSIYRRHFRRRVGRSQSGRVCRPHGSPPRSSRGSGWGRWGGGVRRGRDVRLRGIRVRKRGGQVQRTHPHGRASSCTQQVKIFYPREVKKGPGPPNFQSNENDCVFNKRTVKVCVSCSWRCPGNSAPSKANLTVSLCISVAPEATHEASRGPLNSSKSPSRVRDKYEREKKRKAFPQPGVVD